MEHVSVLLQESMDLLQVNNGTYVDATLGAGGHAQEILRQLTSGELHVVDIDTRATDHFTEHISQQGFTRTDGVYKKDDIEVHIHNTNFKNIAEQITATASGVIADLGWSSDQLEHIPGLSFHNSDDELDMRLSSELQVKAADLLNIMNKKQLIKVFEEYGDVYGKKNFNLVNAIIATRKHSSFKTVNDLNKIIRKQFSEYEISKASAQVFQALRIAVNDELQVLQDALQAFFTILGSGGRLVVITFHSGEEKIVSSFFNNKHKDHSGKVISRSAEGMFIRPSVEELEANPRSRSAKLFCLEKL